LWSSREERPDDVDGPGLYATLRARNAEHAKLLHEMPRLGVSAQVIENPRVSTAGNSGPRCATFL
jgi:hypothetical protein